MSYVTTLLKLSAVSAVLLSGHAAWAQTACNGGIFPPCLNPVATDGNENTAGGSGALNSNTGVFNTAFGNRALQLNTTGMANTAIGDATLISNTTGYNNTAIADSALGSNISGFQNTAIGQVAMGSNTTGNNNTGSGWGALFSNTTGSNNTASGYEALYCAFIGASNTANGAGALGSNVDADGICLSQFTGSYNAMLGAGTGSELTSGSNDSGVGYFALNGLTTGSNDIAVGYKAGDTLTTESNNIDIANAGVRGDSGVVRIGTPGVQTATYVAGISGRTVGGGSLVVVNNKGQLGVVLSSARYKDDIQDMGERSAKLAQLRPVTFKYKTDPDGERQYGLIAEEVARVYPDLVVHGEHGEVESVQYHQLIPMLLNEVQKEQKQIKEQSAKLDAEAAELADLRAKSGELDALKVAVQKLQKAQSTLQAANFSTAATMASR